MQKLTGTLVAKENMPIPGFDSASEVHNRNEGLGFEAKQQWEIGARAMRLGKWKWQLREKIKKNEC